MSAPVALKRVVVVGCAGAGKTTFSAALAHRLQVPHVERDSLGPLGSDRFRAAVSAVLEGEGWVFDGPPYFVEREVYTAAHLILWLDYSRAVVVGRAVWRALGRTVGRLEPGHGQGWRLRQWVAPGGPLWAWQTFAARRAEFAALASHPDVPSVAVLRFGSPRAAQQWLASVARR